MLKPGVTLYFVRHGETDWNAARRYQGRRDISLNATGRAQARRNGRILADLVGSRAASLDHVASPLQRARETMEIMRAELMLDPKGYRTDLRLAEIDYGHWEGRLWAELPHADPEGFAARQADTWGWQPIGGESYRMLSERVALWLERSSATPSPSHGGVSACCAARASGCSRRDLALDVPQDKVLMVGAGRNRWL
jgi:probable phosphoglycerate mutase